jgi:hypothetical protein
VRQGGNQRKHQQRQLTRIDADLADERGSSKIFRKRRRSPTSAFIRVGFCCSALFLLGVSAAKTLQISTAEERKRTRHDKYCLSWFGQLSLNSTAEFSPPHHPYRGTFV